MKKITERNVKEEREAGDSPVGVEQSDWLARTVDLRVGHQERAVE